MARDIKSLICKLERLSKSKQKKAAVTLRAKAKAVLVKIHNKDQDLSSCH